MENSEISWTHHTYNAWIGCMKVGPGCDHCYAEAQDIRWSEGAHWGAGAPRRRTSEANRRLPLKWNRDAQAAGQRRRVFCSSLSDILDNEVEDAWRREVFDLVPLTPWLDWLFLTKRIGNAQRMVPAAWLTAPPANAWWGATIVDQAEADRDILKLLLLPAARRFLSMEPLLAPVDLRAVWTHCPTHDFASGFCLGRCPDRRRIDWIIVGGESGSQARPMHPDWARDLRDQCAGGRVAFHFKQWGEWAVPYDGDPACRVCGCTQNFACADRCWWAEPDLCSNCVGLPTPPGDRVVKYHRFGKKAAGRLLDGRTWGEVPSPTQTRMEVE